MSLLAAARQASFRASPAVRIARRGLGDTVAGPPVTNIPANLKHATNFFTKTPMSYVEFKQQCVSLRIFAFAGVTTGCVLSLMFDPPKSSYWVRYSPIYAVSYIKNAVMGSAPPLFLTAKAEHVTNVPAVATELVTTRRLISGAGSDSDEEH
eukprot:TRINITY_DN17784_c0_g1_i2.p1 TRINITY_DN17784_c0_g1~~TRINITY_DN17784_c0_g1_i2.p1  ORF type:complete len:168 (-),score=27.49 TRINITY_DN17784_c0_g1_i2:431-886(-)